MTLRTSREIFTQERVGIGLLLYDVKFGLIGANLPR